MAIRKRVALLIDTATTWGSGLIEGIADYAHTHEEWHFSLGPRGKYDQMLLPVRWNGDGVIARITSRTLVEQVVTRKIPAVDVSWFRHGGDSIARCTCDEVSVAELAAKYFIDRGFRQFAYCGSSLRPDYVDHLGEAFVSALRKKSYSCHWHSPHCDPEGFLPPAEDLDALIEWLRQLPKPIGLLAFDSLQARQITEACQLGSIQVPHEVAVLGGEHDLLSCTISKPQLSSIDHSPHHVGWTAGKLLSRLMAGENVPLEPILLPASRIITRQSTDTIAMEDDLLAASMQFIKRNYHRRIQVNDILKEIPISRRGLEKGFRKCLGRSPAEEIRRVRVEQAVQLLCDSSWPMPRIASACGFDRPELLTRAFRRELQTTPSAFRKQHLRERVASDSDESKTTPDSVLTTTP
ncbi:MAG: DNA-binding transcriptional regulator [Bythopirellula sp.]|nr:DNA-binding transcriptional regulator [Bythopirellula sp.]